MENLRALMLVNAIRDLCAEGDFQFEPANVESDPTTAATIVESGFMLYFKSQGDRDNAIHAVTSAGAVRTYQAIDTPAPEKAPDSQPKEAAAAPAAPAAQAGQPSRTPAAKPFTSLKHVMEDCGVLAVTLT